MAWNRNLRMKSKLAGNVIDILLNYRRDLIAEHLTPVREEQLVNAAVGGLRFLQGLIAGGGVKLTGDGDKSAD